MSTISSHINDGNNQKLETALLNTIDELTENNNQLKEQLDGLEEQLEVQSAASSAMIAELKE